MLYGSYYGLKIIHVPGHLPLFRFIVIITLVSVRLITHTGQELFGVKIRQYSFGGFEAC